jgi:hypothetical protein
MNKLESGNLWYQTAQYYFLEVVQEDSMQQTEELRQWDGAGELQSLSSMQLMVQAAVFRTDHRHRPSVIYKFADVTRRKDIGVDHIEFGLNN